MNITDNLYSSDGSETLTVNNIPSLAGIYSKSYVFPKNHSVIKLKNYQTTNWVPGTSGLNGEEVQIGGGNCKIYVSEVDSMDDIGENDIYSNENFSCGESISISLPENSKKFIVIDIKNTQTDSDNDPQRPANDSDIVSAGNSNTSEKVLNSLIDITFM